MGDPAGIGPEIALKAFNNKNVRDTCIPYIIGNGPLLEKAADAAGIQFSADMIKVDTGAAAELPSEPAILDPTTIKQAGHHLTSRKR